jgi:hypothetical protein
VRLGGLLPCYAVPLLLPELLLLCSVDNPEAHCTGRHLLRAGCLLNAQHTVKVNLLYRSTLQPSSKQQTFNLSCTGGKRNNDASGCPHRECVLPWLVLRCL